jgi:hypothetical protein
MVDELNEMLVEGEKVLMPSEIGNIGLDCFKNFVGAKMLLLKG